MKLLSIRAPWWWWILHGGKDIENRDWKSPPKYRGTLAIQASATWIQREVEDDDISARIMAMDAACATDPPMSPPMNLAEFRHLGGHIVGRCDLVDVVTDSESPWFTGRYGLVLANPVPLKNPIPFKAMLGLMNVPPEIAEKVAAS